MFNQKKEKKTVIEHCGYRRHNHQNNTKSWALDIKISYISGQQTVLAAWRFSIPASRFRFLYQYQCISTTPRISSNARLQLKSCRLLIFPLIWCLNMQKQAWKKKEGKKQKKKQMSFLCLNCTAQHHILRGKSFSVGHKFRRNDTEGLFFFKKHTITIS